MQRAIYVVLGVLLVPTVGLVGDIVTDGQFKSTLGRGSPPLEVASPDMVVNLNADMVDGIEGADLYTKAQVDALLASVAVECAPRRFYITNDLHTGAEAASACDSGFHFANLYEIAQPSGLRYAYDHANASTSGDSGQGPPTDAGGWIRTGNSAGNGGGFGSANCWSYTSVAPTDSGTIVAVNPHWDGVISPGTALVQDLPWLGTTYPCNLSWKVWCVED